MLFHSCLEPVDLESVGQDNLLVVEGMITDQEEIQKVTLSKTVALTRNNAFAPETGAEVWVSDQNDNRIDFEEQESGVYETISPFSAQLDTKYQLHIIRKNETEYVSNVSTMVPTSPIDSVYAEFEHLPDPPFDPYKGYFNFYVDVNNNVNNNKYFRWIWNSTYQVNVPNPSRWLWTGGNNFIIRERGSENDHLQVEFCWSNDTATSLYLKELLPGETQVSKHRINRFSSVDNEEMKVRYSIEVRQYALSEESYRFWNLIDESNAGQGFLFDSQVGSIKGNITNLDNSNEPVLGFFEVVQERKARRFYSPRDFITQGYLIANPFIVDCSEFEAVITEIDQIGEFMETNGDDYTICYFITAPPTVAFHLKSCAECTLYADSNQRPDFW